MDNVMLKNGKTPGGGWGAGENGSRLWHNFSVSVIGPILHTVTVLSVMYSYSDLLRTNVHKWLWCNNLEH